MLKGPERLAAHARHRRLYSESNAGMGSKGREVGFPGRRRVGLGKYHHVYEPGTLLA